MGAPGGWNLVSCREMWNRGATSPMRLCISMGLAIKAPGCWVRGSSRPGFSGHLAGVPLSGGAGRPAFGFAMGLLLDGDTHAAGIQLHSVARAGASYIGCMEIYTSDKFMVHCRFNRGGGSQEPAFKLPSVHQPSLGVEGWLMHR
ncbi:MAG: hypothetical protein P8L18_16910 [Verrucomicrobiota bacterium]|nr:hypothetical protein [Verrucomicrobiota bacterium]